MYEKFDEQLVKEIYDLHTNGEFPWYFNDVTTGEDAITNTYTRDSFQFTHTFFRDNKIKSPLFKIVKKLLDSKYKYKKIHRIKSNLTTKIPFIRPDDYRPIHQDTPESGYMSLLYYVNDSDGDTLIFHPQDNEKHIRYQPKKGTGVWFPSNSWHSGSNPVKTDFRIAINYMVS